MTRAYKELNFENETRKHQQEVARWLNEIATALMDRAQEHDESKLGETERPLFIEHTAKLHDLTYGSEKYKKELKLLQEALDHHYEANRHHPECHDEGIRDMNLVDIIEMFCDWYAATKRHDDGDIYKSIEHNRGRFLIGDQIAAVFTNTADVFKQTEEDEL